MILGSPGKRGSKIHILVDKRGVPLAAYVSAANRHDKCSVHNLVFSRLFLHFDSEQHLCADRGYDSADIWEFLTLEYYHPHIKPRRRQDEPEIELCPVPGETQYPAHGGSLSVFSVGSPSVAAFVLVGARSLPTGRGLSKVSPVFTSPSKWHFQDRV